MRSFSVWKAQYHKLEVKSPSFVCCPLKAMVARAAKYRGPQIYAFIMRACARTLSRKPLSDQIRPLSGAGVYWTIKPAGQCGKTECAVMSKLPASPHMHMCVCVYRPVRLKARVEGIRQAQRKCLRSGTGASFVSLIGYGAGLEVRPNIAWPFRDCVNNF